MASCLPFDARTGCDRCREHLSTSRRDSGRFLITDSTIDLILFDHAAYGIECETSERVPRYIANTPLFFSQRENTTLRSAAFQLTIRYIAPRLASCPIATLFSVADSANAATHLSAAVLTTTLPVPFLTISRLPRMRRRRRAVRGRGDAANYTNPNAKGYTVVLYGVRS
jgi:hypothetical protein